MTQVDPAGAPCRIRPVCSDDVHAILDLWRAAEAEPSVTDAPDGLRTLIDRDRDALIVAEVDNHLAGVVIAGWDGWRANLYRLAVHPSHRRTGIALHLIREAERRLAALGAVRVNAVVVRHDARAVAFWTAAGYTRDERMLRFRRDLH